MSQPELFGGAGSGGSGGDFAVEGTVLRVVYALPDRDFAVLRVELAGREGASTVVGPLGSVSAGETLRFEGTWEKHATFGEQLRVTRAIAVVPRTGVGVERYLAGLKGLGPELARRLVESFGTKAIEVVADEPWRAAAVRGVGKKRAGLASEQAKARRGEREVMVFLQGHGISPAYAARIFKRWGNASTERVRDNPYQLAREVPGIGFFVADRIARGMGIAVDSPLRVEAAVYHVLEGFSDEGHMFAPRSILRDRVREMVSVPLERIDAAIASLALTRAILVEPPLEGDGIRLPALHSTEEQLARRLRLLLAAPRAVPAPRSGGRAARELAPLSPGQRQAVDNVRSAGVAIITGGPGTGKTTVMKATVAVWEEAKLRVVLAAPTGRAAKRLSEATGKTALTVHRLLEWGRGDGGSGAAGAPGRGGDGEARSAVGAGDRNASRTSWGRNERNPLEADLVVVDEASMLDAPLARALTSAVPVGATLLLVGDSDQLPSVGPGQVLADLIASGAVPLARLTEIFRQGSGSRIVEVAHGVLAGHPPPTANVETRSPASAPDDFYVIPAADGLTARERVVKLCRERIPRAFGLHPTRDIQVLTPMHRGEAGTEALNRALQDALNPEGAVLPRAARSSLRVGDKVLQVKNDYDRDVYNGDIGEVVAIDEAEGSARVRFDEREVPYDREGLDQIELAYAVSVHKSQGSEYPAVVLALLPEHHLLLRRNLLYTAITRGKRLVVIVGSQRALRRAVDTVESERRYTRLRERLRAALAVPKG